MFRAVLYAFIFSPCCVACLACWLVRFYSLGLLSCVVCGFGSLVAVVCAYCAGSLSCVRWRSWALRLLCTGYYLSWLLVLACRLWWVLVCCRLCLACLLMALCLSCVVCCSSSLFMSLKLLAFLCSYLNCGAFLGCWRTRSAQLCTSF